MHDLSLLFKHLLSPLSSAPHLLHLSTCIGDMPQHTMLRNRQVTNKPVLRSLPPHSKPDAHECCGRYRHTRNQKHVLRMMRCVVYLFCFFCRFGVFDGSVRFCVCAINRFRLVKGDAQAQVMVICHRIANLRRRSLPPTLAIEHFLLRSSLHRRRFVRFFRLRFVGFFKLTTKRLEH